MKRLFASVMAALVLAVSSVAAMAADTTLRISLQLPLKSHLGQNLVLFKEEVEKNSDGKIEVQIYDSAQLYKDKEVPQAVGSGAIEMGVASLTRFVGDVPAVDIFYVPFMFNTEDLVRKAVAPGSPVRQHRWTTPYWARDRGSCGGRPMAAPSCCPRAARSKHRRTSRTRRSACSARRWAPSSKLPAARRP